MTSSLPPSLRPVRIDNPIAANIASSTAQSPARLPAPAVACCCPGTADPDELDLGIGAAACVRVTLAAIGEVEAVVRC
jgi:hypothetical protein